MLRTLAILWLCLGALLFVSCSGTSTQEDAQDGTVVTIGEKKDTQKPAYARYNFKSGIVHFKATMMMMDQEVVMYFDDWGRQQRSEININFMGKKAHNVTITDSVFVSSWNEEDKKCTRVPVDPSSPNNIDFTRLTDQVIKTYNLKKEGTDKVLGRECVVYSMNYEPAGLSGKYYVWNGIVLKTDATASGMNVKMEAVKILENAVVPSDKFEIPDDVSIKTIQPDDKTPKPEN